MQKTAGFDIQVRSYKYKGVPEVSFIQSYKKKVGLVKKARDRVAREKEIAGCSLFKHRNHMALTFEKQ